MHLEQVVIGSTVESILYAFVNGYYHINNSDLPPLFYESYEDPPIPNEKLRIWKRLNLIQSFLSRNIILRGDIQIKIGSNQLKAIDVNGAKLYHFENCHVFQTSQVTLLDNEVKVFKKKTYRVIDDFEIRNLGKAVKSIDTSQQKERMHFYISDRIDGANYITDCVYETTLTESQLNDLEYSDVANKFHIQRFLSSSAYRGKVVAKDKDNKPKYLRPEATHVRRIVVPIDNSLYEDSARVKFKNIKLSELVSR